MQATIGILMLDTQFLRVFGDAGNAATWPFPVLLGVVDGASPARVVRERASGPVCDWYSMVNWYAPGLRPRAFFGCPVLPAAGAAT